MYKRSIAPLNQPQSFRKPLAGKINRKEVVMERGVNKLLHKVKCRVCRKEINYQVTRTTLRPSIQKRTVKFSETSTSLLSSVG